MLALSLGLTLFGASLPLLAQAQTYSATYSPSNAPDHSEKGQTGTNACGTGNNQTSECQNVYVNSIDDWCFFAPPEPGSDSAIGDTERIEVSWCIKPGYGTRLIPDGAISGAHFVQTPDYVQVTGVGNLTLVNIPEGDEGGELDPHGADGNGNPIGGLVFTSAFGGNLQQAHEWTNFMSADQFCIRACKDGPRAPEYCQHIYDVMGCMWNMPGNYDAGVFERCQADSGEPMGVYGSSTFHQGDASTPSAHPAPKSSVCTTISSLGNFAVSTSAMLTTSSTTSSASPTATSPSGSTPSRTTASNTGTPSATSGTQSNGSAPRRVGSGFSQTLVMAMSFMAGALIAM
ncbi:hypothetical protein EIP86_006810 [Pleurotus ostreatoroseus]|nr:hypothetical protein EIP86_006810 [Pleurotus ostreatoroseus]